MAITSVSFDAKMVISLTDELDTIVSRIPGTSGRLTPTSTPAGSEAFRDEHTLASGTEILDLTSLPDSSETAVQQRFLTPTALKVQAIHIFCPDTNAVKMTFGFGAATPYPIFGASNKVEVYPGATLLMSFVDGLAVVSASVKHIDITGDVGDVYQILIVAG